MTFAYSTNAYTEFSLFEAVDRIAALGFSGIEIMCDQPHLYPPEFGEDAMARLKSSIAHHGLQVTNLNSFSLFAVGDMYLPSWIDPDPDQREIRIQHTRNCLTVAHQLRCGNISIPPGGPLEDMGRKDAVSLFHRELEKVIPLAESLHLKVLIEPEPGLLMENTREFKDFVKDVASPAVGINFDVGHFYCAGEDPSRSFGELLSWIGHIHIEDIAATRVHNHLIAGHGAIDLRGVLETIAQSGYSGHISLELYPYTDMPDTAGRESRAYLLPLFEGAGLEVA